LNLTQNIFVFLTILLLYIYVGYPVLLRFLAWAFPKRHCTDESHEPTVALIISAYNEDRVIAAKIENALQLDYPKEKLKIFVVSDCSSDQTDAIVRLYQSRGVVLVRTSERRGKTAGLNVAMTQVESEIVVFSDANAMYETSALRKLVRHFRDEKVGYVVGHAKYEGGDFTAGGICEDAYWNFEVRLKKWESDFSSVVGGDGAIYAIRSTLYEPLRETDINDFVNPLQIVVAGYRGIFDPEAWCSENPAGEFYKEFRRKVRIVNRSFNGFLRVPKASNPFNTGCFAWQLVSHKLLRWFSPFLIIAHFVAAVMTENQGTVGVSASICLGAYAIVSFLAFVGWVLAVCRREKTAAAYYYPYYFALITVASFIGISMRTKGVTIATWHTVRQTDSTEEQGAEIIPFVLLGFLAVSFIQVLSCFGLVDVFSRGTAYLLLLVLLYTFLGYPLVLMIVSSLIPVRIERDDGYLPEVALLIAAYNEEEVIERKILNSLEIDYPPERLRIIVASDGSTDRTNEIVEKYKDSSGHPDRKIELISHARNQGKIFVLNNAMESIRQEVVVFSDANVMYDRHAIRKLVRNFSDPRVGAVSGRVVLLNDSLCYGPAENSYYNIEHMIQEKEGATGGLIGADGAMYAIRRTLYRPPSNDTILDDFQISMGILREGALVIHEKEALGYERNVEDLTGELRRKARIMAGGFQCLLRGTTIPSLSRSFLLYKFISHKILRWLSGPLIIILFLALLQIRILSSKPDLFLSLVLYGMIGALAVAMLAHLIATTRKIRLINLLHYLLMLELASIMGCYLGLSGRQKVTWRARTA
jgi:cellulose synthase/poly-beta-1,6-N-acetylglucosamine synthase-like glycosyltransferase